MPRNVDLLRACLDAVEDRMAAPDAVRRVDDIEALLGGIITRVEDEPVGLQKRRRSDEVLVRPERWTACRAAGAEDALGRLHQQIGVVRMLQDLALAGRLVADQI